jgi:hypothetical protein
MIPFCGVLPQMSCEHDVRVIAVVAGYVSLAVVECIRKCIAFCPVLLTLHGLNFF